MKTHKGRCCILPLLCLVVGWLITPAFGATSGEIGVKVDWNQVIGISKLAATLQVVPGPAHRRGSALHDQLWGALRDLKCDDVRYCPWYPYPKLGVAELEPPQGGKTSWDFTLLDPLAIDFLDAMAGRPTIVNFSTIPQWMFKTPEVVPYPADPNTMTLSYGVEGTELLDPSMREVADYFARVVSWYTKGGFADEYGKWHGSGHHYKIAYWEVLNEPDYEHKVTPERYTALYDAVVEAVRKIAPETKFMALALASKDPKWFEYFLDRRNHKPGIPLDMVSYHFYAHLPSEQGPEVYSYASFEQADWFLERVRRIDSIRRKLSPSTGTAIDELGALFLKPGSAITTPGQIPDSFWNLSGALYAYLYACLALQGIETAGESSLWADANDWPEVSLLDWKTGRPNARYWVLKLIHENFGPGDKLVSTQVDSLNQEYPAFAQGFVARDGVKKILLVNKRVRSLQVSVPGAVGGEVQFVDQTTSDQAPASADLKGEFVTLRGLAVAVVTLAQ